MGENRNPKVPNRAECDVTLYLPRRRPLALEAPELAIQEGDKKCGVEAGIAVEGDPRNILINVRWQNVAANQPGFADGASGRKKYVASLKLTPLVGLVGAQCKSIGVMVCDCAVLNTFRGDVTDGACRVNLMVSVLAVSHESHIAKPGSTAVIERLFVS
jgi:hypothetical protein